MKERELTLDVIRIFACLLVISMHAPMASVHINIPFFVMLSYAATPCIGLFFMLSGALLLPVKVDYLTFLKHRLSKVAIPTLVWTGIYLALDIYHKSSEISILQIVASVPFSAQGNGVLWFMYTLTGLYFLAPILSSWIQSATDKELKFVLLLWSVTLFFPLLSLVLDINTSTTGILYYFSGYGGYFLLGYALKSGRIRLQLPIALLVGISGGVIHLILEHFSIEHEFTYVFWYESIFVAGLCCAYWLFLKKITGYIPIRPSSGNCIINRFVKNIRLYISRLSQVSFGVYLLHILILQEIVWKLHFLQEIENYILMTITVILLTTLITFSVCLVISRFQIGKYLIGYSVRNTQQ